MSQLVVEEVLRVKCQQYNDIMDCDRQMCTDCDMQLTTVEVKYACGHRSDVEIARGLLDDFYSHDFIDYLTELCPKCDEEQERLAMSRYEAEAAEREAAYYDSVIRPDSRGSGV